MPGMSPDGNESPQSTIRMRSSSSTQAMFRPTSPTPPRKTTRAEASEETGVLQCSPHPVALFRRGRDERQARDARGAADELQRRLQRDGVARDEQGVEERREVLVDLARGGDVTRVDQLDHLTDLRTHEVGR